jgi:hypothetical protein
VSEERIDGAGMNPDDYVASEAYTVTTVAGEEITIVDKISGPEFGERIVLVTAEDQRYVSADQGGLVEPFNPEKHVGGNAATGEAAAGWTPSADATEAAEAKANADIPTDATDAANAKAELETSLAQQKPAEGEQPLPVPTPSNWSPPPPATEPETTPEVDTGGEKD